MVGNSINRFSSHFPVEKWNHGEINIFQSRELNGLAYRIGAR